MKNVVRTIGVSFVTLVILGAPVLLFLSFMLDCPFYIIGLLILTVVIDIILVWSAVETWYEENCDG